MATLSKATRLAPWSRLWIVHSVLHNMEIRTEPHVIAEVVRGRPARVAAELVIFAPQALRQPSEA